MAAKCDVLERHCADSARTAEIERSVNVRLGGGTGSARPAGSDEQWRDAGVDVCIVELDIPHDADVVEPFAAALAELD